MRPDDPLIAAINSSKELSPHAIAVMVQRPEREVLLKLSGAVPFNVAEVVVLASHLGIDWSPLLLRSFDCSLN